MRRRHRHEAVGPLGELDLPGQQKSGQKSAERETLLLEEVQRPVDGLDAHEVPVLDPAEGTHGQGIGRP